MTTLYFDIETMPTTDPQVWDEIWASVAPPATYKKPESIAEWMRDNRDRVAKEEWRKTSFDGGLGQICVIGWAIDDEEPQSLHANDSSTDEERRILTEWFAAINARTTRSSGTRPTIVGHNVIDFDLKFVWKRAIVHGVKPPFWLPRDPKPWGDVVVDTMTLWDAKTRYSMDRLCRILGLPGKGGFDGSMVCDAVLEGKVTEVAAYCRADVERTRAIHKRLTFA